MDTISRYAKEHHNSVQGAFEAYYGAGYQTPRSGSATPAASTATSAAPSRRVSVESSNEGTISEKKKSTWKSFKQAAKEHHKSINAAYSAVYGQGMRL